MIHINDNGPYDDDNILTKDIQGILCEMLLLVVRQNEDRKSISKKTSRCHGNRRLQHFKKKCRERGINEEDIMKLIHLRNNITTKAVSMEYESNHKTKTSKKRKRSSSKSMNQLSIAENPSKKIKHSTKQIYSSNMNNIDSLKERNAISFHKPSKYLQMPRKLLLHSLRLQLNFPMKKKKEQQFILSRLALLDKQFCLDQIYDLYQTYLGLTSKHKISLVSVISSRFSGSNITFYL